ncbi:heavy-metal-associated domain-containing protein [bacterium]|nr:heavy-metal-associated domain-containing protein [bacterium]
MRITFLIATLMALTVTLLVAQNEKTSDCCSENTEEKMSCGETTQKPCTSITAAQDRTLSSSAKKIVLQVGGMSCTGCAKSLTEALMSTEGVERADVSFENATAEIYYNPAILTETNLGEIVRKAGYSVKTEDSNLNVRNKAFDIPAEENITIFEVPLVCKAAAHLGCGLRSKPLLLELENDSVIAEAWLNRGGTQFAIVWEPITTAQQRIEAIKEFLHKHQDLDLKRVSGEKASAALKGFQSKEGWYRGAAVDRLSEEEAQVIAIRFISRFRKSVSISDEIANQLQKESSAIIAEALTQSKDVNSFSQEAIMSQLLSMHTIRTLSTAEQEKWKSAIEIGPFSRENEE